MQIHSQTSSACGPTGRLELSSRDLSEVFITTVAELPGLIVAALLIDTLGRKRLVPLLFVLAPFPQSSIANKRLPLYYNQHSRVKIAKMTSSERTKRQRHCT